MQSFTTRREKKFPFYWMGTVGSGLNLKIHYLESGRQRSLLGVSPLLAEIHPQGPFLLRFIPKRPLKLSIRFFGLSMVLCFSVETVGWFGRTPTLESFSLKFDSRLYMLPLVAMISGYVHSPRLTSLYAIYSVQYSPLLWHRIIMHDISSSLWSFGLMYIALTLSAILMIQPYKCTGRVMLPVW